MSHTTERKRRLAWIGGAAIAAAVLAFIILKLDWRYAVNDDPGILRSFMGYESQPPQAFHLYIHDVLAWPLRWLNILFPGVAWFSILQIALLGLSAAVCAKSIIQCFVNSGRSFWAGVAAGAAFVVCFLADPMTRITYTQTAAVLGAAAVLQLMSVHHADAPTGRVVRGMLMAGVYAALAYALRQITLLPILGFCGLAVVYIAVRHYGIGKHARRALKPLLAGLLCVAVLLGGLAAWREVTLATAGVEDYMAWQKARIALMDYYTLGDLPQELMQEIGWTDLTRDMASDFMYLDPAISTEAFEKILVYKQSVTDQSLGAKLAAAAQRLGAFVKNEPLFLRGAWLGVLAAIVVGLCALFGKKGAALSVWALTLLLFAACMVYLAAQGRLPARAARMAFLPAAALLFALLAQVLPGGRVACALVAAGCLAFGGWYTVYAVPALTLDEELAWEVGDPAAVLDECALWDNDILFIYDLTLAIDGRLFPNTEEGVPTNVTFWGGWSLRSPGNIEVFDRFGIDLMNFEPEVFLREDVCLATGVADPGPELVLRYLRENVDPTVECSLFGEDQGVYMFQFFIP